MEKSEDKKKMFFLFNPKAGKAQIKNHLVEIVDTFVKGGYEITIYATQSQGDAVRVIGELEPGYDLVVCSGGDGTLDEVVTGMITNGQNLPIGYVPAGSTNDFAGSLKLPKNMKNAAQIVLKGKPFACDVGMFNQDVFVYIAAFGLFTDVSYGTGQEIKNVLGHMAYILEGMKRLPSFQSYEMRFTYDNTVIEGDFLYGMITNSVSVGGFKGITGNSIQLNDGEFEVTLIKRPVNAMELNEIITALLNRDMENDALFHFKTSRLKVQSKRKVAWTLDGEFGGEHKEVIIENKKQAISLLVSEKFCLENEKNR